MKRNLTLSLDEKLLRLARMVCQKRNTTLTQFVRDQLENMVYRDEEYQNSMNRIVSLMKKDRSRWNPRRGPGMSFMKDRTFFDTNILVYAFDDSNQTKYKIASDFIIEAYKEGLGVISTQVLKEFYVTVTQKIPGKMDMGDAEQVIRDFSVWSVVETDVALILKAIHIQRRHTLSFWDAMVVAAATVSGCKVLLTEDLSHDAFLGDVHILNPFENGPVS